MLSIILPVLNEGESLQARLAALQTLRQRGCEVIGVDGGSDDGSYALLKQYCDSAIQAAKGRSLQMNAGAAKANGDQLLFLHADTQLPENADRLIAAALQNSDWGRFDVQLSNPHYAYRTIAFWMNVRSRLTRVATGDQGLFLRKDFFHQLGGFPEIPLMEDIAISKRARQQGRYAPLRARVITSARRWESKGVLRTVWLMWNLRLRYFLGQSPEQLVKRYDD